MLTTSHRRRFGAAAVFVCSVVSALGCNRGAQVDGSGLRLKRVVVYRNGVGYFEREGRVSANVVTFKVLQRDVNDFLATLAVMEQGGSSVRAAAFPMPENSADGAAPRPDARRSVRLSLDGNDHNLVVGYAVETPIWRPTYRLVFTREGARVQAWGIVQNLSGEDWTDVRLSLVTGAPVSFRSELSRAVIPERPLVTDEGAVIQAVPQSETTFARDGANRAQGQAQAAVAGQGVFAALNAPGQNGNMAGDAVGDAFGYGGLGVAGTGWGGGGTGEGTIGLGNIGTMGHGAGTGSGQGYGSGAGRGLRTRAAEGPMVRTSPPSVNGLLSPEAIRRVVLRNIGQVTHCYEQGLAMDASLSGRVVVQFIIGGDGTVQNSAVSESSVAQPAVGQCTANAVRRWQFPAPEGGGTVTVSYPFTMSNGEGGAPPSEPVYRAPTAAPRNVAALAALSTQGGATRYDLPTPVTIPDHSATMVMVASRDVPGERMYLFAPDGGVPESSTHPFRVARFVNRSGAMLERGPLAIFEDGAFLGQGMLDPLPDGATATVPFSLERSLAVERTTSTAVEGARLVSMHHGELTIERFNVRRSTFHVRNGAAEEVRVMVRENLAGAELFEPPTGTENSNGNALAPCVTPGHGEAQVVVTSRAPFTSTVDLSDEQGGHAVEQFLRDGAPAAELATSLRAALELRRSLDTLSHERADLEQRRDDLQRSAEETRANLETIQRNPQAADLRAQLTSRLGHVATELDQLTRRVVELDVQMSERRVRLTEAVRTIDVDTAHPTPVAPAR